MCPKLVVSNGELPPRMGHHGRAAQAIWKTQLLGSMASGLRRDVAEISLAQCFWRRTKMLSLLRRLADEGVHVCQDAAEVVPWK